MSKKNGKRAEHPGITDYDRKAFQLLLECMGSPNGDITLLKCTVDGKPAVALCGVKSEASAIQVVGNTASPKTSKRIYPLFMVIPESAKIVSEIGTAAKEKKAAKEGANVN